MKRSGKSFIPDMVVTDMVVRMWTLGSLPTARMHIVVAVVVSAANQDSSTAADQKYIDRPLFYGVPYMHPAGPDHSLGSQG